MFFEQFRVHFRIPRRIISNRDIIFLIVLWTTLWEKMDTKLKRSTTLHPLTDEQTKVVNRTLVYILRGYNQNHPNTRYENMIYIQNSHNKVVHTSIGKSPFETCFGYLPPSPLNVVCGQQGGAREDIVGEVLKVEKF
jgi:hypothetical protein